MAFGSAVAFAAAGLILPCAQFLLFAATLLGVDGYFDKIQTLLNTKKR